MPGWSGTGNSLAVGFVTRDEGAQKAQPFIFTEQLGLEVGFAAGLVEALAEELEIALVLRGVGAEGGIGGEPFKAHDGLLKTNPPAAKCHCRTFLAHLSGAAAGEILCSAMACKG